MLVNFSAAIRRLRDRRGQIRDYVASTASLAIGLVAQTCAFVIIARALGAEQYGLLTLVTTASSIGLMWCGLGSGEIMRRRVARDRAEYPAVLGHAIVALTVTSLVIALVTAAILAVMIKIDPRAGMNFLIILALVICNQGLTAWVSLTERIFLAHDDFKSANLVNILSGVARAIIVIVVCYGLKVNTLGAWAFWHLATSVMIAIACGAAIRHFGRPKLGIIREELARGSTLSFGSLLAIIRMNVDVLALGAVASPAYVGMYGVARRIIGTASIVSHSFDRQVYSRLAVAGREGASATLHLARKYAGYVTALSFAASILLYFCAPLLVPLFGVQYAAAVPILEILCWSLPLTSLQFLAMDALNAADQHKTRIVIEGATSVVCTGLIVGLTMHYALPGMLASIYVSLVLIVIALWGTLARVAKTTSPAKVPALPETQIATAIN